MSISWETSSLRISWIRAPLFQMIRTRWGRAEKILLGEAKLQRGGSIERSHDLVQVPDVFQRLHDALQCWPLELCIERRQHERDGILRGVRLDFDFQLFDIRVLQPM